MKRPAPQKVLEQPQSGTGTDPRVSDWAIADHVVQLRQLGTQTIYVLPRDAAAASEREGGISLGSSRSCDLQVEDPLKRVSRHHAVLLWEEGAWHAVDVGSKNGLLVDGVKQGSARLTPGTILGVGSVRLIAESLRSIDLRSFLARLLGWGWGDDKDEAIERAMAGIRQAQMQRAPIIFESDSDMIPIARDVHRHLFGAHRPFVVCDPRRRTSDKDVRVSPNVANPMEALEAANRGTLCVRAERLPEDFPELYRRVKSMESTAQLMICVEWSRQLPRGFGTPIVIPPLQSRSETEIAHVVQEYFLDAILDLDGPKVISVADRAWILKHSATSLVDVEKGTRRIVALRKEKTLNAAAALLDMAGPSLGRWLHHRGMPAGLAHLDTDGGAAPGQAHDSEEEDDERDAHPSDGVPAVELRAEEHPSMEVPHGNGIPMIEWEDRSTVRQPPKRARRGSRK
jgi:FHA domain